MALQTRRPTGAIPWPVILLEGDEKAGKAQPFHARLATPSGWTTMGQVAVGDRIIGSNGKATTVTGVFERDERDIYRLTFSDGATTEACDEHLWATWTSSDLHRKYANGPKKGQPNSRPAKIRTTAELRELVLGGTVVHIPVAAPVSYETPERLPLDPYALGLLLGDGGLSQTCPIFTTTDDELASALAGSLPAGDEMTRRARTISFGIRGGATTAALRALGLMGCRSADKHVPESYMRASVADRLALLQGLMDTDGGMERNGITLTSVSSRLACQVQELVRSLGGTCSMTSKQPGYRDASGARVECQTAYSLRIRLPLGTCPFRMSRKVQSWTETRPTFSTPPRRTVRSVDYIGRMPARCIMVDADDHLYLTDDFVVTHNTTLLVKLSASEKVGRTAILFLGEPISDEYGAYPGSRYEIILHDGSWASIIGQVEEARAEAQRAFDAGEPPFVLGIDTATAEWNLLKDWGSAKAKSAPSNQRRLAKDPAAEIKVHPNIWNEVGARHARLMTMLLTFPGIVVITARGKEVAAMGPDGNPVEGKKVYRVEGHKNLCYDVSCWVRMFRDKPAIVVGARSVHAGIRPGRDEPQELDPDWSLEGLIFDALKCDPKRPAVQEMVTLRTDTTPAELRDEALHPHTTADRIAELWKEARASFADAIVMNETGDDEELVALLERVGKERRAEQEPLRTATPSAEPAEAAQPAEAPREAAAPARIRPEDQGARKSQRTTGGDDEAWIEDFRTRLADCPADGLTAMQREVGKAVGNRTITSDTSGVLGREVQACRNALAGASA